MTTATDHLEFAEELIHSATLDLHDGPDTCSSAESKARVLEMFGMRGQR